MLNEMAQQALNLPTGWRPRKMQLLPIHQPTHWLIRGYAEDGRGRKGDRTFLFPIDNCKQVEEQRVGRNQVNAGAAV